MAVNDAGERVRLAMVIRLHDRAVPVDRAWHAAAPATIGRIDDRGAAVRGDRRRIRVELVIVPQPRLTLELPPMVMPVIGTVLEADDAIFAVIETSSPWPWP